MKALLIYPPDRHMIRTNVPTAVDDQTGHYPPLGLMYLASHVEKFSDHEVAILDTQLTNMGDDEIAQRIRTLQPDVVGIQTLTFTLIDVIHTARLVKQVSPDIHVCLGGPHVNMFPDETLAMPEVDSLVLGEGEAAFTDLLNALAARRSLATVQGVVSRGAAGETINTGPRPLLTDLDQLPMPARHLTPYKEYWSVLGRRSPITTMMSSRGCPFRCIFCDRPYLGKRFRCRSANSVVDEMEACARMGIREIFFYDDTFTVDRARVLAIADEIVRRGLRIAWDVRAHVGTVDEEVLGRMKKAGCCRIHYGVEAGTEEVLKTLRKGITLGAVERTFKATRDRGITTLAYFMIGAPGETRDQMLETIDFAKRLGADYVHMSVMMPFPSTEVYLRGVQSGVFKRDYWREFAAHPAEDFVPALWEETVSREELMRLLHVAYRSFYARPGYILRSAMKVRSLGELGRKARAGFRLLSMSRPS